MITHVMKGPVRSHSATKIHLHIVITSIIQLSAVEEMPLLYM